MLALFVAGCKFKHHLSVMSFCGGSWSNFFCLSARFLLFPAAHVFNGLMSLFFWGGLFFWFYVLPRPSTACAHDVRGRQSFSVAAFC
jgi:hypothetical protein